MRKKNESMFLFPEISENPWATASLSRLRVVKARKTIPSFTTLEICAGAGGQALGFEQAGIEHAALIEINKDACTTLRLNRPDWNVIQQDLEQFDGKNFKGVDMISGGIPCPPFSVAGKQLGQNDERNLFPAMIRLVNQVRPRAVVIENVRGILEGIFEDYRHFISTELRKLGYQTGWKLLNACDFGVSQLRPRVVFIALKKEYSDFFSWPAQTETQPAFVGDLLYDLISARGWKGARAWRDRANEIAPTIVGGSHKHGGPDLGPTRARRAWSSLCVDGTGISDCAPERDFLGHPKLTVRMVARIQGFPDDWQFFGKKTSAYRQVGNAFPPPVARAVAESVKKCLLAAKVSKAVVG